LTISDLTKEEETRIMQKILFALFTLSLALFVIAKGEAQTIFFADFEENSPAAFPNQDVNTVGNWVPENPGQIWAVDAFPNGTQGLKQTVEGCGISGNSPLPGVDNFSDGIIQLEMSWGDDDSWGVVLRKSADDKGYLVVFGFFETAAVIVALLDKGCADVGLCLDQSSCENNPDNTLVQVDNGLGPPENLDQTNSVAYFGRIEAIGDTIRVWYSALADIADPYAQDLGAPLVEIQDSTHTSGSVGVWHESQGGSMIDNVLVTGPSLDATAVAPQGKMATTWGDLREQY
jgi:hypothetical protein